MAANPGDRVKVLAQDEIREGILMPNDDSNSIVLKLDNGYNMGIDKEKVTEIKVLEKSKEKKDKVKKKVNRNSKKPTIAILHTGGTIASKVDYRTGAVYSSFNPEDLLAMFPELNMIANYRSKLISKMWSDDLRFKHFEIIAKAIKDEIKQGVDGIIIGIGTDNLAVASAAIAFILENSPIPVLFVGAQRSSDRGSSDAAMNLICAAEFISQTDFAGVAICMHEDISDNYSVILPATKTKKMHSSRRDAFKAINDTSIAKINYDTRIIKFTTKKYGKRGKISDLIVRPKMEDKVGLLKIHVNMFPEQFEFFKGYKGLIIEGTGLGHTPGQVPNEFCKIHEKIYPAIKKVISSGCIVVMTTQCNFGSVHMHVYDKGVDLKNLGVISGKDMLSDTAFVKLSWLLGNFKKEDVIVYMQNNLRGEINDRLAENEFLG
jgi:glutamyl-tRNA(Gln) amidotransferase subunit D